MHLVKNNKKRKTTIMSLSDQIKIYEKCFDEVSREIARYDFRPDHHPQMINLLLEVHNQIDRLHLKQKYHERSSTR
jgi:hypothetical protein